MPQSRPSRLFYRVAYQRFEEAEILYEAERFTGAVYLAGYSVECMLKALILNSLPGGRRASAEAEFRGSRAHQFEWLRQRYAETGAPPLPVETAQSLSFVGTWETSLRYSPGMGDRIEAGRFLREVRAVVQWADNRI